MLRSVIPALPVTMLQVVPLFLYVSQKDVYTHPNAPIDKAWLEGGMLPQMELSFTDEKTMKVIILK